jgi:hypothetical protein
MFREKPSEAAKHASNLANIFFAVFRRKNVQK